MIIETNIKIDKNEVISYIINYNVKSIYSDNFLLDFSKKKYKIFKYKKIDKINKWEENMDQMLNKVWIYYEDKK